MDVYNYSGNRGRDKRRFRIKIYGIGVLGLGLVIGIAYISLYSRVFQVTDIEVQGNSRLSQDAVINLLKTELLQRRIPGLFGIKNILSWSPQRIVFRDSALLTASIDRELFNKKVIIQVNERQRFAVWCHTISEGLSGLASTECFWFDTDGILFERGPLMEGGLIFAVDDSDNRILGIGSQILPDHLMKYFSAILELLSGSGLRIKHVSLHAASEEVRIETYDGPAVLASVRFDPTLSFNSLKTLSASGDFGKIEYIDLRTENKIFYKNR